METWNIRSLDVAPHRPEVLSSDDESRVIAIQLPAGESMQEHQTHERSLLLVIDGEVEVSQGGEKVTGEPGFLADWPPNERREVHAREDSRLLLILAPWPGAGHPRRTGTS
jgi:quercetin dioxygenase-like cupin family protein